MMTKTKFFKAISAVLVLTVYTVCCGPLLKTSEIKAEPAENVNARSITVTGTGSIKAKPDIAILNIGVTTKGATTSIQEINTKTMNNVMASVKALGVDEKDIKTVSYYMNPEYDYSNDKDRTKIIGYSVHNMIEVKVRNIDKAGEVLSAAVDAGANVNNGISFTLSSSEDYYNQALTKAAANAKSKANTLAEAIGVSIGVPSKITENSSYYPIPLASNYNSQAYGMSDASEAVAVSQGEIEITANISVSYEY